MDQILFPMKILIKIAIFTLHKICEARIEVLFQVRRSEKVLVQPAILPSLSPA